MIHSYSSVSNLTYLLDLDVRYVTYVMISTFSERCIIRIILLVVLYSVNKMFKKFDEKESVSGTTQLKSSVQKSIRVKLIEAYPQIEPFIDQILPKKDAFRIVKW